MRRVHGGRVLRIEAEKRSRNVEPVEAGMSRRRFLTFLGTGSAALVAGSAGVLGCAPAKNPRAWTIRRTPVPAATFQSLPWSL